jgi:F-type H+-transporting ATPase subunit delta
VRRFGVTSATPLSDEQRQRLRDHLGASNGQVILTERVDASLLGGLVVQQEDIIRDYSVKARLESLRDRLN